MVAMLQHRRMWVLQLFLLGLLVQASLSSPSSSTVTSAEFAGRAEPWIVLHVSPRAPMLDTLLCTALEPCHLQIALDASPPGATLYLYPGIYKGDYYVSTPVSLVAYVPPGSVDTEVIMDGEHRRRPLTFDNVPAHVEGITFVNGLAARAGCVLVERVSGAADEINNFTRCSFMNCTAESIYTSPNDDGLAGQHFAAAGAVGIYYQYSVGSSFELSRTTIDKNYARSSGSSSVAAGGLLVRHLGPTADSASSSGQELQHPYCNTILIQPQNDHLQHVAGVYRRVKGVMHAGRGVWRRDHASNVIIPNAALSPHMLAYCPSPKSWHIVPISPGEKIAKALLRHPPCTSSTLSSWPMPKDDNTDHHSPMTVSKWIHNNNAGGGQVETIRFQCQDSSLHCSTMQLVHATGAQAHRNGLYHLMNITRAGRPTFFKAGDGAEKAQFIWYCPGPREWIVSDDDPAEASDNQDVCSRGIATLETMAIHPLLASGWRYWDVDFWRTSFGGRGGIKLLCAPTPETTCSSVELVNGPLQDFHTGPYLLTNFSWNRRPTFSLRPPYQSHMWYCGTFNEWVVSETDPTTLDPADEKCSRALSSHPTPSPVPYHLPVRWAQYLDDEWVPTTAQVSVRCVDDCPRVIVDTLGPRAKSKIGVYESIGRLTIGESLALRAHRVYRRLHATRESGASFLFFHADRNCWVISSTLDQEDAGGVAAEACEGSPERGLMHATNWTSPASGDDVATLLDPQPAMACDTHRQQCRSINISAVLYTRHEYLIGIYEPLNQLHNHRPMFLHNYSVLARGTEPKLHFMYYCGAFSKWVIGPAPTNDGRCPAWIASKSTSATHPLVNVHWVLTGDGVRWETTPMGIRAGCADDDMSSTAAEGTSNPSSNSPARLPSDAGGPSSKRGGPSSKKSQRKDELSSAPFRDLFMDCNFSGNAAFAGGEGSAAGAILLDYGRTHVGDDPHGYLRKTVFRNNDALGTSSAGGTYIENTYPFRHVVITLNEVTYQGNRGATGGLAIVSGRAQLNRVQFVRNFAFENGGGLSLQRHSNATGTTVVLRDNVAQGEGGGGYLDTSSSATLTKSEFVNNSCLQNEGTTLRGGAVYIYDSKVLAVTGYGISACFLVLSSSELSCASGTPSSLTDGFGCIPSDNFSGASSTQSIGGSWLNGGDLSGRHATNVASNTNLDAFFTALVGATVIGIVWFVRKRSVPPPTSHAAKRGKR